MKRKVLFSTTDYSSLTQPITAALTKLGHETMVFDYHKPSMYAKILGLLGNKNIISNSWAKKRIATTIQQNIKKAVRAWKPDYLLVIKGESITSETIKDITNAGVTTINWYSDWLYFKQWLFKNAPAYTFFPCVCHDVFTALQKRGVKTAYLPLAAEPDVLWKKHTKQYNISFVGQYSKRREHYFKEISDLGLTIWGYDDWGKSVFSYIVQKAISPERTLEILRHSKIIVNTLTGTDNFQPKEVNFRAFETTGVGTLFLTLDAPMFHKHFVAGKEIVTFTSPSDLRKKVMYYLHNDVKRETIARAGWYRTKKDHNFVKRLQELFILADKACQNQ